MISCSILRLRNIFQSPVFSVSMNIKKIKLTAELSPEINDPAVFPGVRIHVYSEMEYLQ